MAKYLEHKQNVLALFDDCGAFAKNCDNNKIADEIVKSRAELAEDKLVVLVCGEMKRGKSSLLCALLEEPDLFPVNVAVATCLVTMISYAQLEKITVVLEDDRGKETSRIILREEIADYVTEQGNRDNHKNAKLMIIETPNQKLKNGFVFVDTPGVGSMNPEHSQITYGFLNRADVVLFLSDATMPMTEPELAFLKQVSEECPNILFPITKKDVQPDFGQIIESNKDKIAECTAIPREKIRMLPVSSTAKLAFLKNGRERMLVTSNYTVFETLLWDIIYKNRAGIIFYSPLKELAAQMKRMEQEIAVGETTYGGNAAKLNELTNKLSEASKRKQELLGSAAGWQMKVQRQVDALITSVDRIIDGFNDSSMNFLNKALQNQNNIADPTSLLNSIISLMNSSANEIRREVLRSVSDIRDEFEEDTGFEFSLTPCGDLFSVRQADMQLKKLTAMDKLVDSGRTIGMSSMGVAAVGSVAGAIIGGVIGLLGGPIGAIAGVQIGGMLGGVGGSVRGVAQVLKKPTYHTEGQVRAELSRYIAANCNAWRKDAPRYLREIRDNLLDDIRQNIELDKQKLDGDIARLNDSARLTKQQVETERQKYAKRRAEYSELSRRFTSILQTNVEDDGERPTVTYAKVQTGSGEASATTTVGRVDYSFLDE